MSGEGVTLGYVSPCAARPSARLCGNEAGQKNGPGDRAAAACPPLAAKETEAVLPSLPAIPIRPGPRRTERGLEARGQEAGTGSARASPHSRPAHSPSPGAGARAQPEPAPRSPGARLATRASAPAAAGIAAEPPAAGRSPPARPAPGGPWKGKPRRPAPGARTPGARGQRESAPGRTGARLRPQTYRALRAPPPPLEDAPPPPPPAGRAGSGREERREGAAIGSAASRARRRRGRGHRAAPALLARPLPGRPLSGRPPPPPPPLAALTSTDSEKELGVRG
ncbi:WAS/WASL-interacting protein family member 1-like [Dasypus novemcinctus]|uniref:WAS/WASL-interacting protein family member 1-like n=1 Tax=Dasypus novemcinctus TaxID=9361 RepID=UPI0039C9DE27